uniref:Uncharacterized protein n=1 Tax=Cyclophora tenuis TaxID=216820 RepID=A0A7S1D5E1_CYCTE|mmetsp:Transcript_21495/g.36620  ORF Transcript_21495/g.36620 Transcript_21495/m.36620 type:complete len:349 (+) Transcript_21495:55-1101(+)
MADCSCILAALCFFVANVLRMVMFIRRYNRQHFDFELFKQFDPSFIREQWQYRTDNLLLYNAATVLNAFAWFFFLIPIVQLSWCLSRGGFRQVGVHVAIAIFAFVGTFGEVISRLLMFGFNGVMYWIHSEFELDRWLPTNISQGQPDELGWRTLELVFLAVEGMQVWVNAFEWVCLTVIFFLLFYSVATQAPSQRELPMSMVRVGLVIGVLSLFDFAADVLRYEDWRLFSSLALLAGALNTWILLPSFLIALSFQLPKLVPKPITIEHNETIDLMSMTRTPAPPAGTPLGQPGSAAAAAAAAPTTTTTTVTAHAPVVANGGVAATAAAAPATGPTPSPIQPDPESSLI